MVNWAEITVSFLSNFANPVFLNVFFRKLLKVMYQMGYYFEACNISSFLQASSYKIGFRSKNVKVCPLCNMYYFPWNTSYNNTITSNFL